MMPNNTFFAKKLYLLLLSVAVLLPAAGNAQLTAVIGSGAQSGTSSNGSTGDPGPIYRSSSGSSFDYSRHHYVYTQTELANAGIQPGVAITHIAWYKTNTVVTNGPAHFEIWLENSTLTQVQSAPQTWATLTTGGTQVYNTNNQTFGSTTGFLDFELDNPFIYTGGALEVSTAWDISMVSGSPTNGGFSWKKDPINNRTISYCGSSSSTTLSNNRTVRPQVRFTYDACISPGNLAAYNITTTSADLSWDPVNSATGYEYIVNQSPNPPSGSGTATGGTTGSASGLALNTTYYMHVRSQCSPTSFSTWSVHSFKTDDAYCKPPLNVLYSDITDKSADVLWSAMPTSDSYEYIVNTSPNPVLTSANATPVNVIYTSLSGLMPDTKYYFFVRSICLGGNDSSLWRVDSFETQPLCKMPDVTATPAGNTLTAWWNTIPVAISYEYDLTNSETPPAFGMQTHDTMLSLTLSDDNIDQFLHVRSKCNSQFTFSDWSTTQVKYIVNGIASAGDISMLKLYPNPAKNTLFVEGINGSDIVVTDMKCSVLLRTKIDMDKYLIDCSGFAPGMYIIDIRGNNLNEKVRFVKSAN